jgi:hypothetical protein
VALVEELLAEEEALKDDEEPAFGELACELLVLEPAEGPDGGAGFGSCPDDVELASDIELTEELLDDEEDLEEEELEDDEEDDHQEELLLELAGEPGRFPGDEAADDDEDDDDELASSHTSPENAGAAPHSLQPASVDVSPVSDVEGQPLLHWQAFLSRVSVPPVVAGAKPSELKPPGSVRPVVSWLVTLSEDKVVFGPYRAFLVSIKVVLLIPNAPDCGLGFVNSACETVLPPEKSVCSLNFANSCGTFASRVKRPFGAIWVVRSARMP